MPMTKRHTITAARQGRLLTTTALATVIGFATSPAIAQQYIDGGNTINVPSMGTPSPLVIPGTGQLVVGSNGSGTLNIRSGGQVESASAEIGFGGAGTVTVNGVNTVWRNSGSLTVANSAAGTLSIANGGRVESNGGVIGWIPGAEGSVTVTGAGSTWANTGGLVVGMIGTGVLNIEAGGLVESTYANLGNSTGSTATVTVTGEGSVLRLSDVLGVGGGGNGTLTIADKGRVESKSGYVDGLEGGDGKVTVTGAGSTWVNSTALYVGYTGKGALTIANGGRVETNGSSYTNYVGAMGGATGTVTVTGAGSTWANAGSLQVGSFGNGTLTISDGGRVENADASIGLFRDTTNPGNGAVLVTGTNSTWINKGSLFVGDSGIGALTVTAGGRIESQSGWIGWNENGSGSATVTGAGSVWDIAGGLTIGNRGSAVLTVADGGIVSIGGGAGAVTIARGVGSSGTLNIGAAEGAAAVAAGTLQAAELVFESTVGSLVFNHTGETEFGAAIRNNGTIKHLAGHTLLSGDSSGFFGTTLVSGGVLRVDGTLGGTTTVTAGGAIGGTGTLNAVTIGNGGVFAPGNSIGTTHVSSVTFGTGSIYAVEANAAGESDKIVASRTAVISGGTVQVSANSGNYASNTSYTILTANRGLTGTFAGVTTNFAFLTPSLHYDANNVYLDLARNNMDFSTAGATFNQRATGRGVEPLGSGNAIYKAIVQMDGAHARAAFDQLSGEVHASTRTALIEDSRLVRNAAIDRLRGAFDAVGAPRSPAMAYAADASVLVPTTTNRTAVWGEGFGSWGRTASDGNAAGINRSTGGFVAGADAATFNETWRIGLMGGFSHTGFNVRDRQSSGASDNYHVGLYGGTVWGALGLRGGVSYTHHDITTSRSVAFGGFADRLPAGYSAGTAQVFGELGYGFRTGRFGLEPFANLAYVSFRNGDFSEKGGAAALSGPRMTTDVTFTTLGVRGSTDVQLGAVAATARATLGWRHAFGDTTPLASLAFASGTALGVAGAPVARSAAVIEAGLDTALTGNTTIGVSYGGQLASDAYDQFFRANFNLRF